AQAVLSDRDLTADDVLTDDEREAYERLKSERRRGEWLAARVAAKQLVSRHARDFSGYRPDLADVTVAKNAEGAPRVELRGEAEKVLTDFPMPNLTLTHAGGVAIAGIAGPGHRARVGVDLEAIEERDENFADNYFTDTERDIELRGPDGQLQDPSTTLTALWSVKEAVSKALGLGLKLALGELLVENLTRESGHAVADMSLNGKAAEAYEDLDAESLEARVRVDGTFALASAHLGQTDAETSARKSTNGHGTNGHGTNGSSPESRTDERPSKEFAAVAALLKHKGLLDAERTRKSAEAEHGDDLSNWKHGNQ
ncbi:MAG: 4'-phosphopantetheinyl transferase superfamily protein, partial [Bradymonadaceae bacterium]